MAAIKNFDGCVFCCDSECAQSPTPTPMLDAQGRRIYVTNSGQFVIVVEGAAGMSGFPVGTLLQPGRDDNRPDLQIEATHSMGNGSTTVCDTGEPSAGGGGIPGINPPSFDAGNPAITDALNDFACRFQTFTPAFACTYVDASGDARFVTPGA